MVVGTISLDKGVVAAVHLYFLYAPLEDVGNGCTETEGIMKVTSIAVIINIRFMFGLIIYPFLLSSL